MVICVLNSKGKKNKWLVTDAVLTNVKVLSEPMTLKGHTIL